MPSNAMVEKSEQDSALRGWQPAKERAPSIVRADDPTIARWLGMIGLMLVALGSVALVMFALGRGSWIGPAGGSLCWVSGWTLLLFHAAVDSDQQVRRLYGGFGALALAAGGVFAVVSLVAVSKGAATIYGFFPFGFLSLVLALLFLLPFARNETEEVWHRRTVNTLGLVGLALAAVGFIGGSVSQGFLLGEAGLFGLLLPLLGLGYLWAFVGLRGTSDDLGYRTGLAIGGIGVLAFLVALIHSIVPGREPYLVPSGLLLMGLGFLYVALSATLCLDKPIVVLTRRELAAFFYSPIAYFVILGLTLIAWWLFNMFLTQIMEAPQRGDPLIEPVIRYYIIAWFPVICLLIIVPALTMRLLSEERRSGTLEVLLTAPVGETTVVLSKFIAALVFFMIVWLPWGLFLVALRIGGGESFDYRPLLSFFFALAATGAGFLSMGLFFSSLTRNQIVAFILSFVGMLALTMLFFFKQSTTPDSTLYNVLTYTSYIDLWMNSLDGTLSPRNLAFHISAAVFWLFLTVKVMEARKWA
jgi:ABC-type transport system involved in multi-copper enzyme maturation permease subunit